MTGINRRRFAQAVSMGLTGISPLWANAELEKVRAGGVLKVAVYKDFAPFSYGTTGALQGVEVALAAALAKEMGLKLSLLPFDAGENMMDDLRNMVWRGHYLGYGPAHVMLHVPVDRNFIQGNRQSLIFAPYYRETVVFVHNKKQVAQINTVDDLQGLPLGVERGTAAASALLGAQGESCATRSAFSIHPQKQWPPCLLARWPPSLPPRRKLKQNCMQRKRPALITPLPLLL